MSILSTLATPATGSMAADAAGLGVSSSTRGPAAGAPSLVRRQPTSSGASSEMFMPSETMNLQLKIGRAWASSESWTTDPAVLASLIPAEATVGNRLRADELKGAQEGIPLRDEECLSQNGNLHKPFVRPEHFRH